MGFLPHDLFSVVSHLPVCVSELGVIVSPGLQCLGESKKMSVFKIVLLEFKKGSQAS